MEQISNRNKFIVNAAKPVCSTASAPVAANTEAASTSRLRMPKPICLAVDAMGGDFGPEVNVPGALAAARETGAAIVLISDEAAIRQELERHPHADVTVDVVHTTQVTEVADRKSVV